MSARRWFRELWALAGPVSLYWASVVLGLVALAAAVLFTQTFEWHDTAVLLILSAVSLGGVGLGQLLSLSRLRSTLALTGLFVWFCIGLYVIATYDDWMREEFGRLGNAFVVILLVFGPIMASGGFWSLRVNRGLAAGWAPALLFIAAILMVANDRGDDAEWFAGNKHAIWSTWTIGILGLAALVQVGFLAARERHRLHRWRSATTAPDLVDQRADPYRPLAGCGSLAILAILVVVLTLGSALVAPYLWRTGPQDGDGGGSGEPIDDPSDDRDPNTPSTPDFARRWWRYGQQGAGVACGLLTMVVLTIALLLVFGPPTRRQLLLSHLRDPMWPVPPSRRARLHWRLAEIALGDAGIHRKPGETAKDVAERGAAALPGVNLEALVTASEIADRVNHGYTLDPSDADTIRRAAEMTYQAVWETLGELDRVKATYRIL
jgi:hypothetical protein